MNKDDRKNISANQIYALKALAIWGVITAHGTAVPDYFSRFSIILSKVIQSIGSMGVGIFFCVSGYLFAQGTSRYLCFAKFWKRKLSTIIIPWVISATLVYLYVAVRKGGTIGEWLTSILGYLSSYWYLSVLMILYLAFWFILKSNYIKVICILLCACSFLSVALRVAHIIPQNAFTVYLNVFNWCIFFSIGVLLADAQKIWKIAYKMQYILCFAVMVIVLFLGIQKTNVSYFSWFYLPIEIAVIFAAICISRHIAVNRFVQKIGKASFSIYLYHELPWAGLTANICNRFDSFLLVLVRPFIVLGMTYLVLWGGAPIVEMSGTGSCISEVDRV